MAKNNYYLNKYKKKKDEKPASIPAKDKIQFEKVEEAKDNKIPKKRLTAIYLTLIGSQNASKILKHLEEDEIEKIINEILSINKITNEEIKEVEKKFGKFKIENIKKVVNGEHFVKELLNKSFGSDKGNKYLQKYFKNKKEESNNLDFINELSMKSIIELIKDESESVLSIIFSMIDSKKAAEILNHLPQYKSINILRRMSQRIELSPDVLDAIIKKLKQKATAIKPSEDIIKIEGKEKLIDILKHASFDKASEILDNLEQVSPDLANELMDKLFTFNDILKIPKKSLVFALKTFKDKDIAFMLKGADEDLKKFFFSCVTKKRQQLIQDEMDYLGKVKKIDVDDIRKDFIEHLKILEEKGKIVLNPDLDIYIE